jgi:hypothetical protein
MASPRVMPIHCSAMRPVEITLRSRNLSHTLSDSVLLSPAEQAHGPEMSTRNPVTWWKWTRIAAASTFGVLLLTIIVAPLAWQAGRGVTLFSIPIAEFGFVILLPFVLAYLVRRAWLVQDHIDRTFSVWEDQ